jgi:hypothetical protein
MPRVGYIGFGELGYYQAKGLAGEGVQDIVAFVSAVTTDSAQAVAERAVAFLGDGHLFVDVNSCSSPNR